MSTRLSTSAGWWEWEWEWEWERKSVRLPVYDRFYISSTIAFIVFEKGSPRFLYTGTQLQLPIVHVNSSLYLFDYSMYRQVSNTRRTLVGNQIVDHSDVVGASPVGAAPTTSSFSTKHLASTDWVKTTTRWDVKHLSFEIWCVLY